MSNTAIRAEKKDFGTITFKNKEHEKFYLDYGMTAVGISGFEDLLNKQGSDVDVVFFYTGNIREDDFFSALHEAGRE